MNKKLFALILSVLMSLAIMNAVAEDECKHTTRTPIPATPATCTEPAMSQGWKCAKCDYILVAPTVVSPKLNHLPYTEADRDYEDNLVPIEPGDCFNKGTYYVKCKRANCDAYAGTVTRYVHQFEDTYLLATCTEGAWVGQVCKNPDCKAKGKGEYISGPAHQWEVVQDENKGYKPATCTEDGFEPLKCKCGATSSRVVPALGHLWEKGAKYEPVCGEHGGYVYTCKTCTATEKRTAYKDNGDPQFPAPETHNMQYDKENSKTMNCQQEGYELWVCQKGCGYSEKRNVVAKDPNAHVIVSKGYKSQPNCKDGINGIEWFACDYGCKNTTKYVVVSYEDAHQWPADNDTANTVITKNPTCGKPGSKTVACEMCKRTKTVEIPATGKHVYAMGYKRTTCNAPLYYGLVCECGATYGEMTKVRDVAGHELVRNWEAEDHSYCGLYAGFESVKVFDCKHCDYQYKEAYTVEHVWKETTTETVSAACGVNGGYKAYCAYCSEYKVVEAKNADGSLKFPMPYDHTWVEVGHVAPTCKDPIGFKNWQCINDNCNATKKTQWKAEAGMELHNYVDVPNGWAMEPSCYSDGEKRMVCTYCEDEKFVTVKGSEKGFWHNAVEMARKNADKCKAGYIDYKCTTCGVTWRQELTAPLDHSYKMTNTTPTCTKNASYGFICTICQQAKPGCELTEVPGTALGHDKGDEYKGTDTRYQPKKATCLEAGYNWYYCKREGCANKTTPYQVSAKKLNHKYPAKGTQTAANCVNPLAYVYVCENGCGIDKVEPVLNADGEIAVPSLGGHKWEDSKVVAGTCAAKGYTEQKCVRCNATQKINETAIDPNNHDFKLKTTLRPATCTEPGVGIFQCTKCAAKPTKAQVIPAAHTKGTSVKSTAQATCLEKAYIEYWCAVPGCQGSVKVYSGELAKHVLGTQEYVSEDGLTIYKKCTTPKCTYTEVIYHTSCVGGHTVVEIPAVEATCLKPGNTAGKKCSVCGTVIEKAVEIPALKHTEVEIPAVEATCLKVGSTAGKKCSVCDTVLVKPEEIPMLKHVEEIILALEPTCTTPGSTAGKMCSLCGTITVDPKVVPATGHTFKDGACVDCGEADPDFIPDHTHSYKKSYKFNADFTKRVVTYTCECGHTYSEEEDF